MRTSSTFLLGVVLLLACHCVSSVYARRPRILLFTKTSLGAYRHDSIATAVDVITRIGSGALTLNASVSDAVRVADGRAQWDTVNSEDDSLWVDDYLTQFDVVAFVLTSDVEPPNTTTLLSSTAEQSLIRYVQAGGGFVGIHSAAATLYSFPPYGRLVGAFFDYHPEIQRVGIRATTNDNPSTSAFPDVLTIDEEVYHFRTDPRLLPSEPTILLSNATAFADPQASTRTRSDGPAPRPLAWIRQGDLLNAPGNGVMLGEGMDDVSGTTYSGGPGRMFYTSLGHANATWQNAAFQGHVAGGLAWVIDSSTSLSSSSSSTEEDNSATKRNAAAPSIQKQQRCTVFTLLAAMSLAFL